ncbi:MAG: transcription termination factor Rho [Corynebacterium sp.]|nr:transcription termination factor Rho [Corynebacterium sp.]
MTNPENLNSLRLPELREIAAGLGITKISALRKGPLIELIQAAQNGAGSDAPSSRSDSTTKTRRTRSNSQASEEPASNEDEAPRRNPRPRRRMLRSTTEELDQVAPTLTDDRPSTVTVIGASNDSAENNESANDQVSDNNDSDNEQGERRYPESRSQARRQRRYRQRQALRERNEAQKAERARVNSEDSAEDLEERRNDDERAERRSNRAERDERNERADRRSNRAERDERSERNERRNNREDREDRRNNRAERDERNERRNNREDREERRNNRAEREERNERRNNREDRAERAERTENAEPRVESPEDFQDIAGILDIVDNGIAFVRTTGYRESKNDVFVSQQMIRRFGLRRGDAIQGQVRTRPEPSNNRNNNRQRRHNALVRVTSVNGLDPETARTRPKFSSLTPLYPNQRLRLETEAKVLTTRVIDLVMPIGKGQRALIVSPPKAGKTTILQDIANAITTNNPECKLMVVLVDERPEEVTDMQRSVKGEVIDSTFDRPPSEHTTVAELAIERAKRLVELGHDVVVLLDSITRLGRAYNNSSPGSGRILSGGVDSNALYPPKRFLGAARNIEDGGSLTIIATAMVETGSAGDTVIFEEFKGTGNAELKLDRRIAERRVFPAVDINPSGTRKDELLLNPEEAKIVHKLRRLLSGMESQAAIDLLVKQLKKTNSNGEFLMQIAKTTAIEED